MTEPAATMKLDNDGSMVQPPSDDWKPRELPGFMGLIGPLWTRRTEQGWQYGLPAAPKHLNPAGVVHGGALLTLADHVMSAVAWEACGRQACLTLDMSAQFLNAVRQGDWLVADAQVVRQSRGLIFMEVALAVDRKVAVKAQALLKVVQRD